MSVLSLTVVLGLASDPACGGATQGSEFARRLAAIAMHESAGGNPLAIGVNADPARSLPAASFAPPTQEKAIEIARNLIAQRRSVDLGLMGINSLNLSRHGLTVERAFDPCASMKAGADHYADDVKAAAIFDLAHRRYNTGGFDRGASYVASIEAQLRKVRNQPAPPAPVSLPPSKPAPPPCAPAWDGWALAACSARQQAPTPAVVVPPAVNLATNGDTPDASPQP